MLRLIFGLCVIAVLYVSSVYAATVTVLYTEPSQDASGAALNDLKETSIYWRQDGGIEQKIVVPASRLAGGGAISKTFTVADPPTCGSTTVTVAVSATDISLNESVRTAPVSGTKDLSGTVSCVTPKEPTGVSITITVPTTTP